VGRGVRRLVIFPTTFQNFALIFGDGVVRSLVGGWSAGGTEYLRKAEKLQMRLKLFKLVIFAVFPWVPLGQTDRQTEGSP
jgi:hypothetical protein